MSGKGYIAIEEDRRCEECEQIKECRPYGPSGKQICHPCLMAHPEWQAEAKRRMNKYIFGEESA